MTSPNPREALLAGLLTRLDMLDPELKRLDRYYDGQQPLNFLAPEISAQVGRRLTSLVTALDCPPAVDFGPAHT